MGDFIMYIRKGRSIFTEDATLASNSMHPSWWRRHPLLEDSAPVLQKYAIAILSHPCSSSFHGCLVDDFSMEETRASSCEKAVKLCKAKGVTFGRELVGKDVSMNIFLMEKYIGRESRELKPIDLQSLIKEFPRLEEDDISGLMQYLH